jgi:glycosyltransferase involved in cell wall biosynthesis
MNIFDAYIQYSICEGFGMPQIEAAACGVPVLTMNYSAMTDIINNINAEPINIGTYFKELETSAIRTYPDHDDTFIQKILSLLNMPAQLRQRKGFYSSEIVKQKYSWKSTVDK